MVTGNLTRSQAAGLQTEVIIKDSPVKWCAVTLSDVISRGKRLEASVFDVDARQAYEHLKRCKYPLIPMIGGESSPVKRAHYGGRLKRNYIKPTHENACGFIGSAEMLDVKPQPIKFMLDTERVSDLWVYENTVLLSRSGTIGNVSYVNKTLSKFLISEHAMRLECDEYAGYVYAFLKTRTGQLLIRSKTYGAVISQVEPEHIATVPIPDAPAILKQRIHDLIEQSYALRDESNELIDEATKLLIDELALPPIHAFTETEAPANTFSTKLSDLSLRLDASYHVPAVEAIMAHLKKYSAELTTIGDSRISKNVILPGRFKRIYVDEGHGRVFIGGKQIWELDPTNKKYLSLAHHGDRIAKQLELRENMTLVTCSGTIGKVALVGRHWEKWTANQHIIRIVPASKDIAGYINIFLSSDYGYNLITRFTYGSVVDEIDDNHVRAVPIPLLKNQEIQQRINSLALDANAKRYEAYQLEQEALRIMNKEVLSAK